MKIETVGYHEAHAMQKRAVSELQSGKGREVLIVLSHPPTVTIGRKGDRSNVLAPDGVLKEKGIGLVRTERGGDVTFHGPGQLVVYPVLNLGARRLSPPGHVYNLEEAIMQTTRRAGMVAVRVDGIRGVYVPAGSEERFLKLGAVGVAVERGICYHGLALNVRVEPGDFNVIVPCGLRDFGVTSMHLCAPSSISMDGVADVLVGELLNIYGRDLEVISTFDDRSLDG